MTAKKKTTQKVASVEQRIIAGLTDFRDALKDGQALQSRFTIRTVELDLEPEEYGPQSVQATRDLLGVSQAVLAQLLGVSVDTVQSWEQGLRKPSKMACRFMDEIRRDPEHWLERLRLAAVAQTA